MRYAESRRTSHASEVHLRVRYTYCPSFVSGFRPRADHLIFSDDPIEPDIVRLGWECAHFLCGEGHTYSYCGIRGEQTVVVALAVAEAIAAAVKGQQRYDREAPIAGCGQAPLARVECAERPRLQCISGQR